MVNQSYSIYLILSFWTQHINIRFLWVKTQLDFHSFMNVGTARLRMTDNFWCTSQPTQHNFFEGLQREIPVKFLKVSEYSNHRFSSFVERVTVLHVFCMTDSLWNAVCAVNMSQLASWLCTDANHQPNASHRCRVSNLRQSVFTKTSSIINTPSLL